MRIDKNESVGHLAARHPHVVRLFEKWGVDYCCNGHRRVSDLCASLGITVGELSIQVALGAPASGSAERNWLDAPLVELINFITDYYHRQTRESLDRLEALANKVQQAHSIRHPELALISALVQQLSKEMRPHMLKEEQVLFPCITVLDLAVSAGEAPPTPFFGTIRNPIGMMIIEHEAVAALFEQIRSATDDYDLPADACGSYAVLFQALQQFEELTHEHIHLENNVLFPRAKYAEETVRWPLELVSSSASEG